MNNRYPTIEQYYNLEYSFDYILNQVENLDIIYEFGVFGGITLKRIIDKAINLNKIPKMVIGIDSFIGLPQCKLEETEACQDWHKGFYNASFFLELEPEEVQKHLQTKFNAEYPNINCFIIKGWFNEIIADKQWLPASYIHIDCDIYDSTIDALTFLYNNNLLKIGSTIHYDDMVLGREFELGEGKAHIDFCNKYNIKYKSKMINLIEITNI